MDRSQCCFRDTRDLDGADSMCMFLGNIASHVPEYLVPCGLPSAHHNTPITALPGLQK